MEHLPAIASFVTMLIGVGGVVLTIIRWVVAQSKQTKDIESLHKKHDEDIKLVRDELCVLSYAMLACLDGQMQQGCNGNVTKAHADLEKHLNKQAHGQNNHL